MKLDVANWCQNAWQDSQGIPRPAWLEKQQQEFLTSFIAQGLPTRHQENWKYSELGKHFQQSYSLILPRPNSPNAEIIRKKPEFDCYSVLLDNGGLDHQPSELSQLPPGVIISSMQDALSTHAELIQQRLALIGNDQLHPFMQLNSALFYDGVFVFIPKNTCIDKPIYFDYYMSQKNGMVHPRVFMIAEERSQATIIENFQGTGDYFNNRVLQIDLAKEAKLVHIKCQSEAATAIHLSYTQITQQANSQYEQHLVSVGGKMSRDDTMVNLSGQGASCKLYGLFMAATQQHQEHHLMVDHQVAHCTSDLVYKGLAKDTAKAIFNGKVHVAKNAQGTIANQTNKNLLLSAQAQINSKPELEIYADDVKCSHGATIGQLDGNALFYLRSRGVPQAIATSMLISAFIHELITKISDEAIHQFVTQQVTRHLAGWRESDEP